MVTAYAAQGGDNVTDFVISVVTGVVRGVVEGVVEGVRVLGSSMSLMWGAAGC